MLLARIILVEVARICLELEKYVRKCDCSFIWLFPTCPDIFDFVLWKRHAVVYGGPPRKANYLFGLPHFVLPTREVNRRTTCCSALCIKSLLLAKTPACKALHLLLLSQNQHYKRRTQIVVGIQENTVLTWAGPTQSNTGNVSLKFLVRTAARRWSRIIYRHLQRHELLYQGKTEQYSLKNCTSWQ